MSRRITAYEVTTISAPATASATGRLRFFAVSPTAVTVRCGVNLRASSIQLATTEVGATTRNGTRVSAACSSTCSTVGSAVG